jgi:lysophospholipase L1-like esterase
MPAGVDIDEAYHSLLEEKLNREQGDMSYEVINFAVGGYDLRQYLAVIKFKALEYNPDLIIVGFYPGNDSEISIDKIFEQPYKVRPATSPFFHSHVWEALEKHVFGIKNKREKRFIETSTKNKERYMNRLFSEMNAVSEHYNVPIIIVYLNTVYDEEFAGEIERLIVDNNLCFLNVSIPFKEAHGNEYAIYPTDGHPNGKAHRIFSEQLYRYLNKQGFSGITATGSD